MKPDYNLYLTFISLIIAFGYVMIYMLMGRNQNPLTYRYQKVLNSRSLLYKHYIFGLILAIIAFFRFESLTLETYLFSPLIFLLLLQMSNNLIQRFYKRNILIETFSKYSFQKRVNRKAKFLDKFLGLTITLISLVSPIIFKKNKWKEINYERMLYKKYCEIIENNKQQISDLQLPKKLEWSERLN